MKQFLILLLLLPSISHAALKPSIAKRLASFKNEGDGKEITEALLKKGDKPGTELEKKLKQVAKDVMPYLDSSVRNADWNRELRFGIDGPSCFDAAPKLGVIFRALGLPGYVVARPEHVFMIVETPEVVLLVDPTIRQNFGHDLAPSWVPRIFVGTLSELKALFRRDPQVPNLPYTKFYFDPENPPTRRESKMLDRRDKLLSSPETKEHAPLTEFLNRSTSSSR